MSQATAITKLSIQGFKSLRDVRDFEMRPLNVLLGANGSGKSNFIDFFRFLHEMMNGHLQYWTAMHGGTDRVVFQGVKTTPEMQFDLAFARNHYICHLTSSNVGTFVFNREKIKFDSPGYYQVSVNDGQHNSTESMLSDPIFVKGKPSAYKFTYDTVCGWTVYHFHDTSARAGVKLEGALHNASILNDDASNLAAFLWRLREEHEADYQRIRQTIQLIWPEFDDFVLEPRSLKTQEQMINLKWRQKYSNYIFWPSQISDGTLRFICLATALLQPQPPSAIIIDEPELGLHPVALTVLGALVHGAAARTQVILATQSLALVNEFSIEDLVIVEKEDGATVLKRLNQADYENWLKEYSIADLWAKNVLGGRPRP